MKLLHLKAEDYRRQPWKNGGGFTTELAVESNADKWLWRLSIARVERSGPFSDFSGYERTLMLLSGDGMELDFDQAPSVRIERREQPFVFDGGWKTTCRLLGGAVEDLNLIVDRDRARATLRVVQLESQQPTMMIASPVALYYVLEGKAAFGILGRDHVLARGELLRIEDAGGFPIPVNAAEVDTAIVEIGINRR